MDASATAVLISSLPLLIPASLQRNSLVSFGSGVAAVGSKLANSRAAASSHLAPARIRRRPGGRAGTPAGAGRVARRAWPAPTSSGAAPRPAPARSPRSRWSLRRPWSRSCASAAAQDRAATACSRPAVPTSAVPGCSRFWRARAGTRRGRCGGRLAGAWLVRALMRKGDRIATAAPPASSSSVLCWRGRPGGPVRSAGAGGAAGRAAGMSSAPAGGGAGAGGGLAGGDGLVAGPTEVGGTAVGGTAVGGTAARAALGGSGRLGTVNGLGGSSGSGGSSGLGGSSGPGGGGPGACIACASGAAPASRSGSAGAGGTGDGGASPEGRSAWPGDAMPPSWLPCGCAGAGCRLRGLVESPGRAAGSRTGQPTGHGGPRGAGRR